MRRLIAWAASRRGADAGGVLLAESAETLMREAAVRAHPHETGGILVGVWAEGRPWVTHACEVRSPDAGPTHYVLPVGATRNLVEQMRRIDARVGYLGDWHTHPRDATASGVDRRTVRRQTARGHSDAGIVLLIARRQGAGHVFDGYLANRSGVRPVSIVRTGDLAL